MLFFSLVLEVFWRSGRDTNLTCGVCQKEENVTYYKCDECDKFFCATCEEENHEDQHVVVKYKFNFMTGIFNPRQET